VARILIDSGAEIDSIDDNYCSALMLAAMSGYTEILHILTIAGANLNIQDKNGFTALMQSCLVGDEDAVLILVRAGADRNLTTRNEKSAFDLTSNTTILDILRNEYVK